MINREALIEEGDNKVMLTLVSELDLEKYDDPSEF